MRRTLARLTGRSEKEMPFLDHLEELRRAILSALVAVVVCAGVAYAFSGAIIDYVVVTHVGSAQFTQPMEAFMTRVKVSLLLGLVAALPFVTFQIWSFVVPGLLHHERRLVLPLVAFSTVLFLTGIAFSYFVLTPLMLKMLLGFGTAHLRPDIKVDALLDFIIKMGLASGILFQLPLVVALLTLMDLVSPRALLAKWRHAIVAILILAAVVTPGDGPSQIVLAVPVIALYFLSILLSLIIVRRGQRRGAAQGGENAAGTEPAPEDAAGDAARYRAERADRLERRRARREARRSPARDVPATVTAATPAATADAPAPSGEPPAGPPVDRAPDRPGE